MIRVLLEHAALLTIAMATVLPMQHTVPFSLTIVPLANVITCQKMDALDVNSSPHPIQTTCIMEVHRAGVRMMQPIPLVLVRRIMPRRLTTLRHILQPFTQAPTTASPTNPPTLPQPSSSPTTASPTNSPTTKAPIVCSLANVGESCRDGGDCCSGSCSGGKPSRRTCLSTAPAPSPSEGTTPTAPSTPTPPSFSCGGNKSTCSSNLDCCSMNCKSGQCKGGR
jgi:hypothetical protein